MIDWRKRPRKKAVVLLGTMRTQLKLRPDEHNSIPLPPTLRVAAATNTESCPCMPMATIKATKRRKNTSLFCYASACTCFAVFVASNLILVCNPNSSEDVYNYFNSKYADNYDWPPSLIATASFIATRDFTVPRQLWLPRQFRVLE